MVLDELNATHKDCANIAHIISKHEKYMNKNSIKVEPNIGRCVILLLAT